MKILLPDIHKTLTRNLCVYLDRLGHKIIIPSNYNITHYPKPPVQQWLFNNSWTQTLAEKELGINVMVQDKDGILDSKPDVLLITNFESQFEILNELAPNLPNAKVAFYSGNDYWNGWFDHSKYQNYLFADWTGSQISDLYKMKNGKFIIPFIYPAGSCSFKRSFSNTIGCYINDYQKNFPRSFNFYKNLQEIQTMFKYELMENKPINEVYETMMNSSLTIHIKEKEGCGLATLESLAFGRPLILHRQLAQDKSLIKWSHQFLSAFFIENGRDYFELLTAFSENPNLLLLSQESAYNTVRKIVNEDEQLNTIKDFLNNLV